MYQPEKAHATIIDFGMAFFAKNKAQVAQFGLSGSPRYMSPEAYRPAARWLSLMEECEGVKEFRTLLQEQHPTAGLEELFDEFLLVQVRHLC